MSTPEALQHLAEAQAVLDQIEVDRAEAITQRDEAIALARDAGIEASAIAKHLGITRQIVYRALKRT